VLPLVKSGLPRIKVHSAMLPEDVILRGLEGSGVEVSVIDPLASMQAIENHELEEVAGQVREKLRQVISTLFEAYRLLLFLARHFQ